MGLNLGNQGSTDMLFTLLVRGASLKEREKTLKLETDEWKQEAYPLLIATGNKSFKDENVGTMSAVEGTNKSINRDLLIANLLKAGLDADKVATIVDKSTKVSKYTTVQFVGKKEKVG